MFRFEIGTFLIIYFDDVFLVSAARPTQKHLPHLLTVFQVSETARRPVRHQIGREFKIFYEEISTGFIHSMRPYAITIIILHSDDPLCSRSLRRMNAVL